MSDTATAAPQPAAEGPLEGPQLPSPDAEVLREAIRARAKPTSFTRRTFVFVLSVGFFAWSFQDRLATDLPILMGVLLLHELGHYLAMRAFGYRNLQIMFIPFFGAAASGKRTGKAPWQEAIVLLAGPVPGIVLGLALLPVVHLTGLPLVRTVALQLVVVNLLNLLPIMPLDGGRLFHLALFSRHAALEVAFTVVTGGLLAVYGVTSGDTWLSLVGLFTATGVVHRLKLRSAVAALGPRPAWPADALQLGDGELLELDKAARGLTSVSDPPPAGRAARAELVLDALLTPRASFGQALAFGGAWGAAVAVALAGTAGLARAHPADWREYRDPAGRFTLQLPSAPKVQDQAGPEGTAVKRMSLATAANGPTGGCVVQTLLLNQPIQLEGPALDAALAEWAPAFTGGGEITSSAPSTAAGLPAHELWATKGAQRNHYLLVPLPARDAVVMLIGTAATPEDEAVQRRCFETFALLSGG